ncbi:MAG TPA: hypothetical protein DDX39_04715 [Bacteroidales bacterium]|nr:MAG: hypothetical protein A2W98_01770 [Bacteroidetes bacterium GWF2_33_38]OFY76055.1 MAG: hypothetical protein A2265_07070 [Bacteroidetes bacterium RIFOXYA12_FULL_33_9]OFY90017.1 MAG: hypothetical protein A2236_11740 [Bacteroidetes bacterium RIFOXYA2_FULL_33_7]HBF87927.1 hypothetical protein [Bacteroidales bacterium]
MLEFSKAVLKAVSVDRTLFNKELRKIVNWYGDDENQKSILYQWCNQNFDNIYNDIIVEIFTKDFNKKKEQFHLFEIHQNN